MELTKNYIVYAHKNKINGKFYIGLTKQNPAIRWRNGEGYKESPLFYSAILKYGWENFEHIILESNLSKEEAEQKEKYYIKYYNSNDKNNGYNLTSGGEKHYVFTEEVKSKLKNQKLGKLNPMYGTHLSEQEKSHLSEIFSNGGNPASRRVKCEELNIIYSCCREAAEKLGKDRAQGGKVISRCALGQRQTAYGYHWRYVD